MTYKGYLGSVNYSDKDQVFFGKIEGINGLVNFWIMLIPALFMTTVCSTYVFISRQMLHLPEPLAYGLGIACLVVAAVWFTIWYNKQERNQQ